MRPTLHKYILHEIWPTFLASLFAAVFIILATRMLSITELIVTRGIKVAQAAAMVAYLLPDIIVFALPAASLISVVVAFLRLSADGEIIALKSSGVSLYQMLPPVILLCFSGFLIAVVMSLMAVPWGNRSFKNLIFQIAESKADLGIKERVFSEPFDRVVFYVNSISSREGVMRHVFVVDRRDRDVTNTIVAQEARIFMHPKEKIITVHFAKGTVFVLDQHLKSDRTITFETYDLNIGLKDIMAALAARRKAPKELTLGELVERLRGGVSEKVSRQKYNETLMELLERFSIPLAVFLMGIVGLPLGVQMKAGGRSAGIGVSLVVFLTYYMCLAGARSLGETGTVPPGIGVWIPDLFLLVFGSYLLRRGSNERSLIFLPRVLLRPRGFERG
jgi:lipopolysaccharide export system permease protein